MKRMAADEAAPRPEKWAVPITISTGIMIAPRNAVLL
jgi:hypothetical protein